MSRPDQAGDAAARRRPDDGVGAAHGRRTRRQGGFTLIELMVVAVVIAAVTLVVLIGVGNIRGASVQTEAGKLAAAVRHLYTLSVLHARNYRLVIDIDSQTWWGEVQSSSDPCKAFLAAADDDATTMSAAKDEADDSASAGDSARANFGAATTRLLAKHKLGAGVVFDGVMTSHQNDPTTSGQATINFFPNGTAEAAFIWVGLAGDKDDGSDEEDVMTVEVLALQGTAHIHATRLEAREFLER